MKFVYAFTLLFSTFILPVTSCERQNNRLIMTRKCAAHHCRSGYRTTRHEKQTEMKEKRSVFRFPCELSLRKKWIEAIRRGQAKFDPSSSGVCELHFTSDDFCESGTARNTHRQRRRLKPNAVPTVVPSRDR